MRKKCVQRIIYHWDRINTTKLRLQDEARLFSGNRLELDMRRQGTRRQIPYHCHHTTSASRWETLLFLTCITLWGGSVCLAGKKLSLLEMVLGARHIRVTQVKWFLLETSL